MPKLFAAEAKWCKSRKYWKINVQIDGQRRSFYSNDPTKKGKKEAEAKAESWATVRSGGDMRLSDAFNAYMDSKKGTISASTYAQLKTYQRKICTVELSGKKISRVTVQDLQNLLDGDVKAGKQKQSIDTFRNQIVSFWNFCRRSRMPVMELLPGDLQNNSKLAVKEKPVLQPEALQTLFTSDKDTTHGIVSTCWHINAFRLAAIVGLRRGEITALRWQDITDTAITVNGAVNGRGDETRGKTKNAIRAIALSDHARSILNAQREMMTAAKVISPWVFPDKSGKRETPRQFYEDWKRYAKANGIDEAVTFHCLRHTAVSLYKSDVPLALLKQTLGHSASMDTLGHYGHQLNEDARRTADLMDKALDRYIK